MARKRAFIPPIARVRDGFAFNIGDDERQLVARLLTELSQLLVGESDDPRLVRIFPPAYHLADDAEADAEYQRLMREELVASRLTGITTVNSALQSPDVVDEETMVAFVQAINGLRLVLGTMLDVSEDLDPDDIDDDDPQAGEHHLYNFLSWLLDWAVRALGEPASSQGT
ncbi:MAG: hypothetical protein QOJ74_1652 [Ilumatobacteraceae bacterium]|jgi:hypothetical protein|nr:hypothetical protein [Ilumatobacteraceae bacterium]